MSYPGLSEENEETVVEIAHLIAEHRMAINGLIDQMTSILTPVLTPIPKTPKSLLGIEGYGEEEDDQ